MSDHTPESRSDAGRGEGPGGESRHGPAFAVGSASRPVFLVLAAISACHFLNDMVQSLIPAIYPLLKASFHLTFGQVGLITFTVQVTASLLQPLVGLAADRRPIPYSLPVGMTATLVGLLLLAWAPRYAVLLVAAALVGVGSSVFHPESARVARRASGGQFGRAQSLFQVGGNAGQALGPVLAALLVLPRGQASLAWFSLAALLAIGLLTRIGAWSKRQVTHPARPGRRPGPPGSAAPPHVGRIIAVLLALIFSKYVYLASLTSYYTFYLISRFQVSVATAQLHLFVFLGAVAVGTLIGGPVGDRIGRKYVIWGSILGVLPFTLLLPYASLRWTGPLTVVIGLVLASAFSAILVYAQELIPGKVGLMAGLFFGFAFGIAGVGAAVLGRLADGTSIGFVYHVCAFLPAIGLLAGWLPDLERTRARARFTPSPRP
ncbi:MAG TPA: MFS transporter [Candidatus Baltobacteraceae bacterium]|nr:MFS transporter [Candidatus Baltobacteraceae bacterium]